MGGAAAAGVGPTNAPSTEAAIATDSSPTSADLLTASQERFAVEPVEPHCFVTGTPYALLLVKRAE